MTWDLQRGVRPISYPQPEVAMGCDSWFSGTDTRLWLCAHETPVAGFCSASGFSNIVVTFLHHLQKS